MLEVKNLMVFYENAIAVNDVSLAISKKEIVGILGSNSAGKSTLMNTISGLCYHWKIKEERKSGMRITVFGKIEFEGCDIHDEKPVDRVRRGIVLCRERHPIFRDSDTVENLKIGGYLQKTQEIRKSIEFVFGVFPHLKDVRKRKAGLLSGGEQQMLAIGIALVAHPKLLLMDEPLLGLSPALQKDLVAAIRNIREEGLTILIAEQFARPLLPIIDRGYVIESGTLILADTGQRLMNNPEVRSAYFGV